MIIDVNGTMREERQHTEVEPGSCRWSPLMNWCLIKADPLDLTLKSGLVLPHEPDDKLKIGTVIEAGPGTYTESGVITPNLLQPGDRVMWTGKRPVVVIDDVEYVYTRDVECAMVEKRNA